jgi:hypothetical protein
MRTLAHSISITAILILWFAFITVLYIGTITGRLVQIGFPIIQQFITTQLGSSELPTSNLYYDCFSEPGLVDEIWAKDTQVVLGAARVPSGTTSALDTEVVLEALKPKKAQILNRKRKYLTAKEKIAEQNWIDRSNQTDWNDKDCWLA